MFLSFRSNREYIHSYSDVTIADEELHNQGLNLSGKAVIRNKTSASLSRKKFGFPYLSQILNLNRFVVIILMINIGHKIGQICDFPHMVKWSNHNSTSCRSKSWLIYGQFMNQKKHLEFRDICIFVTCQMGVHVPVYEDVNSL